MSTILQVLKKINVLKQTRSKPQSPDLNSIVDCDITLKVEKDMKWLFISMVVSPILQAFPFWMLHINNDDVHEFFFIMFNLCIFLIHKMYNC